MLGGGPTVQTDHNGGHFQNGIYTRRRLLRTRELPLVANSARQVTLGKTQEGESLDTKHSFLGQSDHPLYYART
jgi:hypothetical protein